MFGAEWLAAQELKSQLFEPEDKCQGSCAMRGPDGKGLNQQVRWNPAAGLWLCDADNGAWIELVLDGCIREWRFSATPFIARWLQSLGGKAESEDHEDLDWG